MRHIILANWKMSPSKPREAQELFNNIKVVIGRLRAVQVLLAPPALFLHSLAATYSGNKVLFAAQKISPHEGQAHTGSLSAQQFANSGASHCLIGHSEGDDTIDALRVKTFLALKYGLIPIVFIGESKRDNSGDYLLVVREQVLSALQELSPTQLGEIIFCYEPVWAIGQKEALSAYDVQSMALYIRKILVEEYGAATARKVRVLYGGSVSSDNIVDILKIVDLDGVAVGRVSADAEEFIELLKIANKA